MTKDTRSDDTMEAIERAVEAGRGGDATAAKSGLLALWSSIGAAGDALHRCTIGHYLADLCAHPAEALVWDLRALDAADALTNERAKEHHESLDVASFYPSLHLNLADDFRRLGAFEPASVHIECALDNDERLPDNGYGAMIRRAVGEVRAMIEARCTTARSAAPGVGSD